MRLVTLVLLATAAFGQTYTASTFAGVWLPENLPGTSVSLNQIGGVAVDAGGNVFLSLPQFAAVMRLDATTGILTRVAGNTTSGFSGDNGPAVNAQLYRPGALALDPAGSLYIADTNNRRIRKVTNGIITTVAGNGLDGSAGDGVPATGTELHFPYALAIDAANSLYISDASGVVRKVTNGVIASVAGAQGYFAAIAVDVAGNLFLLDAITPRVLKVSNGVATNIAGDGTYGFSGDGGPASAAQFGGDPEDGGPVGIAVDSSGNLYVADTYNSRIRKVSNGVITTVAGGSTGTQLTDPSFITVGSAGDLYFSDPSNNGGDRIRKVANGVVATIAGNGFASYSGDNGTAANAQFYQPEGVAIDSAGRMYVADTYNNRVRMIANGVITTVAGTGIQGFSGDGGPATSAQLATPLGVAVDPAGNLYIADVNNRRIRKVSGGVITTVAGTVGDFACGVAVDSAGNVYVSDCWHSLLFKVSNGNATTLPAYGSGLALDPAGNLYMTNSGAIIEISNGAVTTIGGGSGVAFDAADNRYIADGHLGLVRKLSNGTTTTFPMSPSLAFPGDPIGADSSGNIYDAINNVAGIGLPVGITVDSSGNIYSSDFIHILVLKPAGAIAPPTSVSVEFIDNAASNHFLGVAPGEIVTLKGSGLGPAQLVSARPGSDGLYPTQLSGTSVQFNGVAAPLLYTSATQVAAVAPYGVTGPAVQVTVTCQGQTSVPATVQVFAAAPGLFTADGTGAGQAAAINQDGTINSASNPAPLGTVISLYATGGGQISPAGVDGQVSTSPLATQSLPVQAYIGLQPVLSTAQLQYAGPAPGEIAGLMQINVPLPPGLQPGSAVPVAIFVGTSLSSSQSNVTIAVR
jgi:trimeric autotransporter adhesin